MGDVLERHLLPLFQIGVDDSDDDSVVVASAEFLLLNFERNMLWASSAKIQQMTLPFLVRNHAKRVQPQLMRKCILTLLGDDTRDFRSQQFLRSCNDKQVAQELTLILEHS